MKIKKRGLGRGLSELLGETPLEESTDKKNVLNITELKVGSSQPRQSMDSKALQELADSIKSQGLLQPIVVRQCEASSGAGYEIIAGERRWRASKMAGLTTVPVIIKNVDDKTAMAMALIENLQRENLNSFEEAEGLARLIKEYELTHADAAKLLGKSRTAVSNLLRLLSAPNPIQSFLKEGHLEQGHVRAMLALSPGQQIILSNDVKEKGHSVRWVEDKVKEILRSEKNKKERSLIINKIDKSTTLLETRLSDHLNLQTKIFTKDSKKGEVRIRFNSTHELEGFLARIGILEY